jgi:hypothetical protein
MDVSHINMTELLMSADVQERSLAIILAAGTLI